MRKNIKWWFWRLPTELYDESVKVLPDVLKEISNPADREAGQAWLERLREAQRKDWRFTKAKRPPD